MQVVFVALLFIVDHCFSVCLVHVPYSRMQRIPVSKCLPIVPTSCSSACLLQGECSLCPGGTQSFQDVASSDPDIGPLEALFRTEERTTTRYMLTGRRWEA